MNGGSLSGFQNAPVTRAVIIACGFLTAVFSFRGGSRHLGFSFQDITNNPRIWRILASSLAFSSSPELLFGLCLLYYFRVFERQIGSNKFSVFILFSGIVSSLLEFIALILLKDTKFHLLASGPYAIIFSLFIPFYFDIPVSSRFHIFGLNFSDKFFIYLAGLQLVLSNWRRSLVPGFCGLLVASLYRLNLFGIRRIKIPGAIASFFSRYFAPPPSSTSRRNRNIAQNLSPQNQGNYGPQRLVQAAPEPPQASVETLLSMGFDENSARQALRQARNDVNAATNILLEAQSH